MKLNLPRCRFYFCILTLLSVNHFLPTSFAEDTKLRPITNAKSVIAIYQDNWLIIGTPLIFAVWDDGHIVWSENKVEGGAPYRSGKIKVEKITSLLSRMEKEKFFSKTELSRSHTGPEAIFTTIYIKTRKKRLTMESWYEFNEEIIKSHKDYGRLKMLRNSSKETLFYRMMWNEIRLKTSHLIPSESKPIEGKIVMKAGIVSWSESDVKKSPSKVKKALKKK